MDVSQRTRLLEDIRAKEAVFSIAKQLGVLRRVRDSGWRRQRLAVLCYHGVSMLDEHEWNPELYVSPEFLRQRLQFLRENGYTILKLDEACRRLYAGTLPPRSVALTFDDGTLDFERQAVPVLREFGAPATVYLSTYYSEVRLPVYDTMLSYVLWRGRRSNADLASLVGSSSPRHVGNPEERAETWAALYYWAKHEKLSAEAKDVLLGDIGARLGVDYAAIRATGVLHLLSPASVRDLPHDLVDVQLHTYRHRVPLDRLLFLRELGDNAARIQELRRDGGTMAHFCYPSGNYRGTFLPWLREFGVEFAATCVPGLAQRTTEPLLLPRFTDTMARSPIAFEACVSGLDAWLPRRRKYRLDDARLVSAGQRVARAAAEGTNPQHRPVPHSHRVLRPLASSATLGEARRGSARLGRLPCISSPTRYIRADTRSPRRTAPRRGLSRTGSS